MKTKRFRMFCGPNGSGKSTLISEINKQYNLGYYINADIIKTTCDRHKYLKVADFCSTPIRQYHWELFLKTNLNKLNSYNIASRLQIKDNIFICKAPINSYDAALIATFFRYTLLKEKNTFSFETVMSHESKVLFLKQAKEAEFKTYFYFVCTQDPEINKQRVINRVQKGGHDVDAMKIEKRYYRSLNLLYQAFNIADRAFLLDSSNQKRNLILEKKANQIYLHEQIVPEWVAHYLLDKY